MHHSGLPPGPKRVAVQGEGREGVGEAQDRAVRGRGSPGHPQSQDRGYRHDGFREICVPCLQ